LGSEKWLLGPAAIFVYAPRRWVLGLAVQNLWSVGGDSDRAEVNELLLRPLVNVNLPREWYVTSKPNIHANWNASSGDRWIVEAGAGIGKVFRIGRLGIGLECQFFGLPVRPKERLAGRLDSTSRCCSDAANSRNAFARAPSRSHHDLPGFFKPTIARRRLAVEPLLSSEA